MRRSLSWVSVAALALGLAFLYAPILLVIGYSFNAGKLVTVWSGFSLRWYAEAFANEQLMASIGVSLRVAALSATLATVVGTTAALVLVRHARFVGRGALVGLIYAPLVLPEVITGLALLLLFVELGWERGILTVALSHAVLASAWVAVLVQSRLVAFDRSLEEAAIDLGATPARALWQVTLPIIAPTLAAGWLLAFTLSIDDLVIASFASGPGSTTLPMRIYGQARLGVTPEINAVSTLMIAVVALGIVAFGLLAKREALRGIQAGGSK
jgi:putrescine transport system permease protein